MSDLVLAGVSCWWGGGYFVFLQLLDQHMQLREVSGAITYEEERDAVHQGTADSSSHIL